MGRSEGEKVGGEAGETVGPTVEKVGGETGVRSIAVTGYGRQRCLVVVRRPHPPLPRTTTSPPARTTAPPHHHLLIPPHLHQQNYRKTNSTKIIKQEKQN